MNKHKLTAIIIAPFLAIGGFLAADYFMSPVMPPDGHMQRQALKVPDTCNLAQQCHLTNGKIQIRLSSSGQMKAGEVIQIQLQSSKPIDQALLAFSDTHQNHPPSRFSMSNNPRLWQLQYRIDPSLDINALILQLVIIYQNVTHFAELRPKLNPEI